LESVRVDVVELVEDLFGDGVVVVLLIDALFECLVNSGEVRVENALTF
jgi:hypothetical protein